MEHEASAREFSSLRALDEHQVSMQDELTCVETYSISDWRCRHDLRQTEGDDNRRSQRGPHGPGALVP